MNSETERKIVDSFILKTKRERAIWELGNEQKRRSFVMNLSDKLDRNCFHRVDDRKTVYQALKEMGAPDTCYIISASEEVDGKEYDLKDGLRILDYEFELLSCIPGKLAYFRETPNDSYILIR